MPYTQPNIAGSSAVSGYVLDMASQQLSAAVFNCP